MTTVKASLFWQLPLLHSFYNSVTQGALDCHSSEVQLLVYRCLSHYQLLPWPGLPDGDQQWAARATHHSAFLAKLTGQYLSLKTVTDFAQNKELQEQMKPCVKRTLALLTDLVESIAVEGGSISKKICYQSIQGHVQATLAIFPVYIHQPDVTDGILQFFLALFQGLRVQMGVPFTEQTIRTFMSMFSREQLKETINQESTTGYKVVEKILKILEVIVMEPGQSFKALLPSIVNICMQEIYPIIAERASPDIKPGLYQLLHQLLHHNWRYFFKASVLTSFNSKSNEEQMEHEEQFISIMQAFGQSFLQPDIDVFRYNMEALENLNESKKLYSKKIVKEMMLGQFLNVLIQVLIVKSHDLLCEEIAIVVYNMASVDFDGFYSNYLPQLLRNCDGIDDNQKATLAQNFKVDTDLPSFTQCLHRFVNDLRYYRLINSSLPAGSVTL